MKFTQKRQGLPVIGALVLLIISQLLVNSVDSKEDTVPPQLWWRTPAWSPDGKSIFVGAPPPKRTARKDGSGHTYYSYAPSTSGTKNLVLRANDYGVVSVLDNSIRPIWSPDSRYLAATKWEQGSSPDTLAIYDAATGTCATKFHGQSLDLFAWSPDSQKLLCPTIHSISMCNISTNTQSKIQTDDEYSWNCPAWSPTGKAMAACSAVPTLKPSSRIKIWDSSTLSCLHSIDIAADVGNLGWSKDGRKLLYSQPGSIKAIDAESGIIKTVVETDECASFAYAPSGEYLAYKDRDHLNILNASSFAKKIVLQGPKNGNFSWLWSPNERFILLSTYHTIVVFDTGTGKPVCFKSWVDFIEQPQITPNGKFLVVSMQNHSPEFVPINLSHQMAGTSILNGGTIGGPKWQNYPCPSNMEECFAELDKSLTNAQRARFKSTKEDELFLFGGGSMISDTLISDVYTKWDKFELKRYLLQQGISDDRDLFGIVVDSYWRRLNNKPLNLAKQAQLHRNWWQSRAPVVKENRPLSAGLKNFLATDQNGTRFSLDSLKAKLKVVSFLESDSSLCAEQLKSLKALREKYATSELIFVVFIVPPENLKNDRWPSNTSYDSSKETRDAAAREISAFQRNPGNGFLVATAPLALCKEYLDFQYANVNRYNSHGPPQTLIIKGDFVTARLNGFDHDWTETILNHQIIELLKSANCLQDR